MNVLGGARGTPNLDPTPTFSFRASTLCKLPGMDTQNLEWTEVKSPLLGEMEP